MIFEGNYLKGEKNGKGKEYHDAFGYVIFEGEYLDGKRWKGKGNKYDDKGNLISFLYIPSNSNFPNLYALPFFSFFSL